MKKVVIFSTIILTLILYGCQSEEARKQEEEAKLNEQISVLINDAENNYQNGKLLDSQKIYEEIYSLQPTNEHKIKVEEISTEIENAKKVNSFLDELYNIQKDRLRSGISVSATDFEYILKDIKILIDEFERIDTKDDTAINKYILQLKNDTSYKGYKYLKEQANDNYWEDSSDVDLIATLDSSYGASLYSTYAFFRDGVLDSIDIILSNPAPSIYLDIKDSF